MSDTAVAALSPELSTAERDQWMCVFMQMSECTWTDRPGVNRLMKRLQTHPHCRPEFINIMETLYVAAFFNDFSTWRSILDTSFVSALWIFVFNLVVFNYSLKIIFDIQFYHKCSQKAIMLCWKINGKPDQKNDSGLLTK